MTREAAPGDPRTRTTVRLLRLYPRAWQERYGDELAGILGQEAMGARSRIDIVRGALDARLHPDSPSRLPVVAALTTSALATAHAIALATQPVPTEWPGYLDDALPLIAGAVAAAIPAIIGLWLRLGDEDGAIGRAGIVLAVIGHLGWLLALIAAATRVAYGPSIAVVAAIAMTGTILVGVALVGHSRTALGGLLAAAGLAGLAPPALGWATFAAAWTGVAAVLVMEWSRALGSEPEPRDA